MKPKVYLETTIPSLLVARPSPMLRVANDQHWNCRHIANAMTMDRMRELCARRGFPAPVICTPYELMLP